MEVRSSIYFHIAFPNHPVWCAAVAGCGIDVPSDHGSEAIATGSLDESLARKNRVLHRLCDWAQDEYDQRIRDYAEAHPSELTRWPKFGFSRHAIARIAIKDALTVAKPSSDLLLLGDDLWLHLLPSGAARTDSVITLSETEASKITVEGLADNAYRAESGQPEIVGWWVSDQRDPTDIPEELFPPYA